MRINRLVQLLIIICMCPTFAVFAQSDKSNKNAKTLTYQNPIDFSYPFDNGTTVRTIKELRDPCIIREGDTYYLVYTHYPFTHHTSRDSTKIDYNSSPGIRLYSSKDLKNWKFEKWLVKSSELPVNSPYKHRFWAPELRKFGRRFYLTFYADNWIKDEYNLDGKMGYVPFVGVADKITGPYEHFSWLKGGGCDTDMFQDDNGKTYAIMPFGNQYIQEADISNIDKGKIKLIGERKMIVSKDNTDVGLKTSPSYLEGPWMTKYKDKYMLFFAGNYPKPEKNTSQPTEVRDLPYGYWVGLATADSIWGPYTKQPQVFQGGHIAVFTGPDGKPWFSYRGESGGKSQGLLCVDPIPFEEDGTLNPFLPSTTPVTISLESKKKKSKRSDK